MLQELFYSLLASNAALSSPEYAVSVYLDEQHPSFPGSPPSGLGHQNGNIGMTRSQAIYGLHNRSDARDAGQTPFFLNDTGKVIGT